MSKPLSDKQIDRLIADYLGGSLSDVDRPAFEAWLRASPDNPRRVARLNVTDFGLREVCQDTKADYLLDVLNQLDDAAGPAQLVTLHNLQQPIWHRYRLPIALGGAIAAVLVIAVTLIITLSGPATDPASITDNTSPNMPAAVTESTPRGSAVATLTAERDAVWASDAPSTGDALASGQRLTLTAGFIEITTNNGAIAILEAPATVELIDSPNALRLHTGKLVGICETDSSKGFLVRTPHMDITDLGTEFGVTVTPDSTEATVFVGEVAVKTPDAASKVITHSQTARVTAPAANNSATLVIEDKPAEPDAYAHRLPRPALITDASINLPRFKIEVVPNGLYEDTRLYTDREHEINGVDAAGLPSVLIGGDFVRMPADARPDRLAPKDGHTLQLDIQLSGPADLYLLIEPHMVDGNWLKRDYERTGMTIGKDSVGGSEARGTGDQQEGGVGPGVSVDQTFEVWKSKKPASGQTAAAGAMTRGMYALIAVPAQQSGPHE